MLTSRWFSVLVMGSSLGACLGAVDGAADRRGAEHALGESLVGSFEHLPLADTCHELDLLTFASQGRYRAERADGTHEEGTFVVSDALDTLTLEPTGGAVRNYTLEAAEDLSAIQLTSSDCVEVLASAGAPSTSECDEDADCGEGESCQFAETGGACVGGEPNGPSDPGDVAACAARTGGALVTFDVHGEQLTVWSTNLAFIEDAQKLVGNEGFRPTPVFNKVLAGHDACSGRSWHVDPADMGFGDFVTEVCDAMPSYIDANLEGWVKAPGNYCPWGPRVISVDVH